MSPLKEAAMLDRINKLEQMVGKLTQKMRVFKKSLTKRLQETREKRKFIAALPSVSI
jgi:hypothetical protein